jgi:Arc/MetJ-type ribon-helix-helix transcriptional regulator
MARINVFLGDGLLKAVDTEAVQVGTNRSALIQAALTEYLQARQRARDEAEVQRRMDNACKRMDALAKRLGDWDPVPLIRAFRKSQHRLSSPPYRPRERRGR